MTENAEKLLYNLVQTVAEKENYEDYKVTVKPTTSGGANYTTKLFEATVTSSDRPELKLFGKVAVFSEQLRQNALSKYYDTEIFFFTELMNEYEKIQNKHSVKRDDRLVLPRFYGCNPNYMEETFLFEDLRAAGFVSYDRFESIDWTYAARTVEEMAKLHALSVAYGQEHPKKFEELLQKYKFQIPAERNSFRQLCSGWFSGALDVTKDEYKDRFKKFMDKYGDMEETTQFYAPLRCPAITHGDFKITNLLHKVCEDGRLQVCILDYQTLRAGSMASDLIYFIFTGSDQEFRTLHYSQLVDHYYAQLCLSLTRLGVDPEQTYSREDFDYEMKIMLPFGLTVAVYVLLVLMVEAEDAPAVDAQADLQAFAMKPNPRYGDRLNGILEDYIKWGVL